MDWGTLKEQVALFLHREDMAEAIPVLLNSAARKLQNLVNLTTMEVTAEYTLAVPGAADYRADAYAIPLPNGTDWSIKSGPDPSIFKAWFQGWMLDENGAKEYRLLYLTKNFFERAIINGMPGLVTHGGDILLRSTTLTTGYPLVACRYAGELLLFPRADADTVGKTLWVDCFSSVDYSDVEDDYSDELIDIGWVALLYGALIEGVPYLGKTDPRLYSWIDLYTEAKAALTFYSVSQDNVAVADKVQ